MVYNNKQYNTRHSGRYNTGGQFVSAGVQNAPASTPNNPTSPGTGYTAIGERSTAACVRNLRHQGQQEQQQQQQPQQTYQQRQQSQQPNQFPQQNNLTNQSSLKPTVAPPLPQPQAPQPKLEEPDVAMKVDGAEAEANGEEGSRPSWMKSKMPGVKKLSKKEKRRRQNQHLRRIITPKNALMVLNEMVVHEQLANQFKVAPADGPTQYYKSQKASFCADLTLDGVTFKGYGENKLMARNAAAEQAIRALIIKRMNKAISAELSAEAAATAGNAGAGAQGAGEGVELAEEDPLPMIQLASFALHKLFSEWEYEGHKVPQLKPPAGSSMETDAEAAVAPGPRPRPKKAPKELPLNAAAMHPAMLLTYMRPHLEYRELAVEGDRPQNMTFTMGVDVDNTTYIGKASNKKEARKAAARAACTALFGVQFHDAPSASAPLHAPVAAPAAPTPA